MKKLLSLLALITVLGLIFACFGSAAFAEEASSEAMESSSEAVGSAPDEGAGSDSYEGDATEPYEGEDGVLTDGALDEPTGDVPDDVMTIGASDDIAGEAPDDVMTIGASDGDPESADKTDSGDDSGSDDEEADEEDKRNEILLAAIGAGISLLFIAVIVIPGFVKKDAKRITVQQLTESALMVAVATVCSVVKFDLPFGGGVTVVSMLPLILISHRYGWRWGLTTAFVYSLIQLVLGLDNVAYATSTFMAFGVIFLDYIVAYTVIGLSGIFGKSRKAVAGGISLTFFLRFVCHYVTGVWIWKAWMPDEFMGLPMKSPFIYSALYNGWYMLVEYAITMIVAMLIYKPLEKFFTGENITK